MVLMNLLACMQGRSRDAGAENGLVDTARKGKGGTDEESNVTDIHCHVQVR